VEGVGLHGHPTISKLPMTATGHSALEEDPLNNAQSFDLRGHLAQLYLLCRFK
jgi:hypothetical protein